MFIHVKTPLQIIYFIVPVLCFFPFFSSPLALAAGIFTSIIIQKKYLYNLTKLTTKLLQTSIVLMGFSMNLTQVIETTKTGFFITMGTVFSTLIIGIILGKLLKIDKNINLLISSGTAICGGSAIAAVAPIIDADPKEITFSITVVFVLNAIALFIFPIIGNSLNMSQETFGYWAAIAIHDTSSVVGAGAAYGVRALELATTIKLTRTLWIIPIALIISIFNKKNKNKIKVPWFIGFFIIAILINYYLPCFSTGYEYLSWIGRKGMLIALFFIGTSFSKDDIKTVGLRSFILGVSLWFIISVCTLVILL